MLRLLPNRAYRILSFSPTGLAHHLIGKSAHALRSLGAAAIHARGPGRTAISPDLEIIRTLVGRTIPEIPIAPPALLDAARNAARGRVEILGYGLLDFSLASGKDGVRLAWHEDRTCGFRWPAHRSSDRLHPETRHGADIKVPWELSRAHHWMLLARAFALTSDRSFLDALSGQWDDWIASNPPGLGVNWMVPMEAAIRSINWLWTFATLQRAGARDFPTAPMKAALMDHGAFIDRSLEYSERPSDHYLADLVGLLYLGVAFRNCRLGRRWLRVGYGRFWARFRRDLTRDGVFRGGSIGYHRLVAELFWHAAALSHTASLPLPADAASTALSLSEFLADMMKPDGRLVAFGDDDGGHVLAPEPGAVASEPVGSLIVRLRSVANLSEAPLQTRETAAYPDAGFFVMRRGPDGCAVDAFSEQKNLPFGYRHSNRLGFELWVGGRSLIVDPGTYCYTRSLRKRRFFRSTRAHNTPQVDGLEQNETKPDDLAWLSGDGEVSMHRWDSAADIDLFEASLASYLRLARPPVRFAREIGFAKRRPLWWIRDRFEGQGRHDLDLRLTFGRNFRCRLAEPGRVLLIGSDQCVELWLAATFDISTRCKASALSPRYGEKVSTDALLISGSIHGPASLLIVIVPSTSLEEAAPEFDHVNFLARLAPAIEGWGEYLSRWIAASRPASVAP